MKTRILLIALVLATAAATGSPAQTVNSTFDKHTNFYKYRTYKWVSIQGAQQLDELTSDQLLGTLDVELAKKGLSKSETDAPDLFIGYQIARPKDKPLNNSHIGAAYGSGVGGNSGSVAATTTVVHSGQLVLDLYDASTKQLVWRAVVSDALDEKDKPDKKQKRLDKAVEKLLKDYPPRKS